MECYRKKSLVNFLYNAEKIKKVNLLLSAFICVLLSSVANSQTLDSRGTEFWLTFNQNHRGSEFTPSLFLSSSQNSNVTIEIPFLDFTQEIVLQPNIAQSVELPIEVELLTTDTVTNQGIRVISDQEISVYGLSLLRATTDAYLGLPVDVLGTEYIVSAWGSTRAGDSHYSIVATEDGTEVLITPTLEEQQCFAPTELLMNRGDTYIHAGCDGIDTSGTVITASSPIGVFGGHECANIPNNSIVACDHIVEQITPIQSWGTQFITAPLATRIGGDTFRIIASEDNTEVMLNGEVITVLERTGIFEVVLENASNITATSPILLVQFSNGSSFDDVTSDPFKMIIPPFEQFLNDYTFSIPTEGFANNFVNIVVEQNQAPLLVLDGEIISAENFQTVIGTDFVYAQIPIDLGSHNLSGAVAGIFTYGFDSFDSYGYPGGLSLSEVASVESVGLLANTLTIMGDGMACANAVVLDQDQLPLQDIRVDFEITILLEATTGSARTDDQGIAEFCIEADPESEFESATVRVAVGGFVEEAAVDVIIARVVTEVNLVNEDIRALVGDDVVIPIMVIDQDGEPLAEATIEYTLEFNGEVISGNVVTDEVGAANITFASSEPVERETIALFFAADFFEAEQVVNLAVTEGVEIDGEIVSGAGSMGSFMVLMLGLLGLSRVGVGRVKKPLFVTSMAVVLAMLGVSAKADNGWYLGAKLGLAEYEDVSANVAPVIAATGDDLSFSVDDQTTGYELFAGFQFTNYLSARLSFIDLGEYSVQVSGTSSDPEALGQALNNSIDPAVQGFTLGLAGHLGVNDLITIEPRAGFLIYDSEQDASIAGFSNSADDSGLGYTLGAGVMFELTSKWQLGVGYDAYWSEDDDLIAQYYSAQIHYRFNR